MREVDTSALQPVARSLGIQNPATAVLPVTFDDDNLQQMWDATKFARFPLVRATYEVEFTAALNTTERRSYTVNDLFQPTLSYGPELQRLGFDVGNADVWLRGVQMFGEDGNIGNLDELVVGARWGGNNVGTAQEMGFIARGTTAAILNPIEATGLYLPLAEAANEERPRFPVLLSSADNPDALGIQATAGAGGACSVVVQFFLLFTIKGTPLWYHA